MKNKTNGQISLRCEGKSGALMRKIFDAKDEFAEHGVAVTLEIWNSISPADAVAMLFITIGGTVSANAITLLIQKLFEKKEESKGINIHIKIENSNITFNLPEDQQKLLDHYKKEEAKG
ncbi:MAG: hypothetical protein KGJ09_04330 [Candidatus Omnitrophica bacterium]|nr:hypothetical protein [Candidatus Omnitrophota bacterium]MDE2213808.1 hypothetical protein [Candidatus Omnitrophota bacterium]